MRIKYLIVIVFFSFAIPLMAVTLGPNDPTSVSNDTSVGTVVWSNPSNVTSSNNSYAEVTGTGGFNTNYLKAQNFGFNIPSDATVVGIKVEVEGEAGLNDDVDDNSVKIVKSDGTLGNQEKTRPNETWWPLSEEYWSYGGVEDLWEETWTPNDINDENFGFVISANIGGGDEERTASVDHIRITVYYDLPTTLSFKGNTQLKANTWIK